jgi:small ligand-binding sensory domain FIST
MVEPVVDQMKWASALSTRPSLEAAVDEVIQQAQQSLGVPADLGLVFISSTFASEYPRLLPLLEERLSVPNLIGCGGGGIIGRSLKGNTEEVEGKPALSLTLAYLPGVNIHPFHLDVEEYPDLDSSPDAWIDLMGVGTSEQPQFIILAEPTSSKINDLLQGLDFAYPESVKIGGLAAHSTIDIGGLFCNRELYHEGAVGVALSGNIVLETIVAQGCRPIGQPYRITEAERNILLKLEEQDLYEGFPKAQTPLEVLQDLLQSLDEKDQVLAQHSLFVGIVRDEFKQNLEPRDFLIRTLVGVDPRMGAIAIGDRVRSGQRIQFHLRDAHTSAEDLEMLLEHYQKAAQANPTSPTGALLFSCLGRGQGLYGQPNFDSQLFSRYLSNIPLSGFFSNGEVGPVGGRTFLHGFTSAFGIFRQA